MLDPDYVRNLHPLDLDPKAIAERIDALETALRECVEALELHGKTYPAMVKGYTLDAAINGRAALETHNSP